MQCNPTIPVTELRGKTVYLGVFATFNANSVAFDFSAWEARLGNGVFSVSLLRPGDATPYAVAGLTIDGTLATWTFDATDTAYAGWGRAFLSYVTNDAMDMTVDFDVYVAQNSAPAGETPPEPLESWYQRMLEAAANTQIAAANAAQSAALAAGSAQGAWDAQQAVENMTVSAEALPAGSPPTVEKTVSEGVVNLEFGIPQGTKNYNDLDNKPSVNGNILSGNQTGASLGLVDAVAGKSLSTNDYTDADKAQIDANQTEIRNHVADKQNPHEVTKAQVGLWNVDNTSDADKPVSTATQAALNRVTNSIGDLADLETTAKSNLVAAINEAADNANWENIWPTIPSDPTQFDEDSTYWDSSNVSYGDQTVEEKLDDLTETKTNKTDVVVDFMELSETSHASAIMAAFIEAPPETFDSPGAKYQMALDENYLYVCVAENTWRRVALSTF